MTDIVDVPASDPIAIATPRKPSLLRLIREDVACVRLRDPAARSELETLLTYPGIHALIWHRLAHRLWEADWRFPARLLSWFGRFLSNVDIHPAARIGRRFFIDHGACVVIGETAEIGDDVTLYHGVTLGGTTWNRGKRHPTLGNGVVVGAGAKLLGPIIVGDYAKVGSNAVVVKDVPPGATAVGIPARIIMAELDQAREAHAAKLGFSAYGLSSRDDDPVAQAIRGLTDHTAELEARIAELDERLERLGRAAEEGRGEGARLRKVVDK
jgi:serine O-acetyltransferase